MRTTQLEYFIAVAKYKNFTRAANECYIAQSAISQQINALEEELGFPLFIRQTRKVILTEAGELFYKEVPEILHSLNSLQERCRAVSEGVSGTIKIGVAGYSQTVFMDKVKEFISLHPGIHVEFVNMDTKTQYEQLINEDYDIALTAAYNIASRPEIMLCGNVRYPLAIFANEKHPFSELSDVSIEQASRFTNIFAASGDSVKNSDTASELYSLNNIEIPEILYVQDHNMTTLLLDFNLGVAIAPQKIESIMPDNVICRPLEGGKYTIELTWAYSRNNSNPALLKLVDFLIDKNN